MTVQLKLVKGHSLDGLLEAFLNEQAYQGSTHQTLRWYRKVYRLLVKAGIEGVQDLTKARILGWLADARAKGLSPATIANYDRAIRIMVGWWYRNGYLDTNPYQGLPRPRNKTEQVKPFSQDELERILSVAKASSKRNYALVLLLLDTGIRSGEARNLKLHDVNWVEGLIRVSGKTGERVVPFGLRTRRALTAYLNQERKANAGEKHVFLVAGHSFGSEVFNTTLSRLVRKARVQNKKVGPHTFRHTFAVEFLKAGGNVFELQRILGHSRLETTQRYVSLLVDDLKRAHQRFSPVDRLQKR